MKPKGKSDEDMFRLSLEDCYMLARRRIVRLTRLTNQLGEHHDDELADWNHIVRFCERAGLRSSVLRVQGDVQHGVTCEKKSHEGKTGMLHGPEDDSPYHVVGCSYCGRCHGAL